MNELENYFKLGIVEIVYTDVLPVELAAWTGRKEKAFEKASEYGAIQGSNFFGHTASKFSIWAARKSNLEMIYTTLWGKMWKMGGSTQNKIHESSLRDALHLDACWINQADVFITTDGTSRKKQGILQKRDALYAKGFDTKIYTPEECLAFLKEDFRRDFGTDDVTQISKRLHDSHRILLGSNGCKIAVIKDPETGEILFHTHWIDGQLHVEANIYDDDGQALAELAPNQEPRILENYVSLAMKDVGPKVFYTINPTSSEQKIEQFLRIGGIPCSHFSLTYKDEIIFCGRIVPSGHVLFEGKFFNACGKLISVIDRKLLRYEGISFFQSTGNVLPGV